MSKAGKRGAIVLFAALAAIFFVLASSHAKAAGGHLVINEIYPAPTGILPDTSEWVELYNPSGIPVNLLNLRLKKQTSATLKPLNSVCNTSDDYYYICELGDSWLTNTGTTITLLDGGIELDKVSYPNFENNKGKSYTRIPNGQDTENDADDFRIISASKGSKNLLPDPIIYSNEVIINEILPEPSTTSNDEYVELFNSGDENINLKDWRIADLSGMEFYIPAGVTIGAHKYFVFCKDSQIDFCDFNHKKFSLNDTGDTLFLTDPNGDSKYTIKYDKANRGQSYSKFSDGWKWTLAQTPSSENIFLDEWIEQDEEANISLKIALARQKKNEEIVEINGVVTVLPGTLSSQYFYIQDETAGIQIYSSKKDFPVLRLGAKVSVSGEMAESNGERRLKILSSADIKIISFLAPLTPENIVIDQISELYEGKYIQVKGTVTKTSGNTFYIHGSGEVQVVIRESTNIHKPKMRKGDTVEISGIISQYKDHFRILPTKQSDVIVLSSGALPKAGPEIFNVKYLTVIIVVWSLFLIQKRKLGSLPHSIQKI